MTLERIEACANAAALSIFGALHPSDLDGVETLILLGPREPGFWATFTGSPEYRDGAPDPLDRWSKRVISALAGDIGGSAFFPSDGPPYPPFFRWALDSGRAWQSPVRLLVHDTAGLFASYRGAIGLTERLELPPTPAASPCDSCAGQPCLTACPAGALTGAGYDVPACKSFLETEAGRDCLTGGCLVRRACPVSQRYGRLKQQSAFHMRAFL